MRSLITKILFTLLLFSAVIPSGVQAGFFTASNEKLAKGAAVGIAKLIVSQETGKALEILGQEIGTTKITKMAVKLLARLAVYKVIYAGERVVGAEGAVTGAIVGEIGGVILGKVVKKLGIGSEETAKKLVVIGAGIGGLIGAGIRKAAKKNNKKITLPKELQ